jgi:hypothetical protein
MTQKVLTEKEKKGISRINAYLYKFGFSNK